MKSSWRTRLYIDLQQLKWVFRQYRNRSQAHSLHGTQTVFQDRGLLSTHNESVVLPSCRLENKLFRMAPLFLPLYSSSLTRRVNTVATLVFVFTLTTPVASKLCRRFGCRRDDLSPFWVLTAHAGGESGSSYRREPIATLATNHSKAS